MTFGTKFQKATPENIRKRGCGVDWGHGISRGIEERACGNSSGQLKKKYNFKG